MEKKNDTERKQQLAHADEQLWRQVKVAAIMSGKSMTEWVEEALRARLEAESKKAEKKS